jgi:hypothetical protein
LIILFGVSATYRLDFRKRNSPEPERAKAGNSIPRIARLMALAIRFDSTLRERSIRNMAEIGRLGHVTRARMSQIMTLLDLAPDIEEQILFLNSGRINERNIRSILRHIDWEEQRNLFHRLRKRPMAREASETLGEAAK